jgi:hypothetical protein
MSPAALALQRTTPPACTPRALHTAPPNAAQAPSGHAVHGPHSTEHAHACALPPRHATHTPAHTRTRRPRAHRCASRARCSRRCRRRTRPRSRSTCSCARTWGSASTSCTASPCQTCPRATQTSTSWSSGAHRRAALCVLVCVCARARVCVCVCVCARVCVSGCVCALGSAVGWCGARRRRTGGPPRQARVAGRRAPRSAPLSHTRHTHVTHVTHVQQ